MFEQTITAEFVRANRAWSTMAGAGGEMLLVAAIVLTPLVSPYGLPRVTTLIPLVAPPSWSPARPAPPPNPARADAVPPAAEQPIPHGLVEPGAVPSRAAILVEEPPAAVNLVSAGLGVPGGIGLGAGAGGSVMTRILHEAYRPPAAADAPVSRAVETDAPGRTIVRIKLGGQIQHRKLLKQALPVYPPLARQARVSGDVELLAVIGIEGTVKELTLVSGNPLLVRAAMDAVRQWLYNPTLLNGEPVEVLAPIRVTFRLQ
jgi:periplasmic protein TonB